MQGRDRSAHHVFRSSMSDPVYYTRSSMSDPSYPGPQRGMVTPQVNVAEGVAVPCHLWPRICTAGHGACIQPSLGCSSTCTPQLLANSPLNQGPTQAVRLTCDGYMHCLLPVAERSALHCARRAL